MSTATASRPRVIHSLPGRIRVHIAGISSETKASLEADVAQLDGVQRVSANPQTQNVLVQFDEGATREQSIIRALADFDPPQSSGSEERGGTGRPQADREREPGRRSAGGGRHRPEYADREVGPMHRRARIAVRGIDRCPELAQRLVERLGGLDGVKRVSASQLTGRVLVEYSEHQLGVEDLLSHVSELELPDLPGEDTPSHPLDPAPLIQSTARVIGASLGLAYVAMRRAIASPGAEEGGVAGRVAGTIGIIEGLPPVETQLEELLGPNAARLALSGMTIISLTFAGSPLGLAVSGAGALRLMTTIRARRREWRRYEERVEEAAPAHPGARIEIEPGERLPLPGRVIHGFGTAISSSGEVVAVAPGRRLDAGTRLAGTPATVELEAGPAFTPDPRSSPPTPSIYDRYLELLPPVSLAYALLTGLITRSPGRALTALLLVNPRSALIGAQAADDGAEARVLRQGTTVIGSRASRSMSVPDALILDPPRVLAERLELAEVSAMEAGYEQQDVAQLAAAISAAAGSPWGHTLDERVNGVEAVDGTFDGRVASAEVDGERWLLGPASSRRRSSGDSRRALLLELRSARSRSTVGTVTLSLAPATGLDSLLEACERRGVDVEVAGDLSPSAKALIEGRAVRPVGANALARLRELQAAGARVMVLSDSS
ncbi:MAG: hypothetical protein JOZ73_05135, partial [Solirubrobacterales bacterium]|nr:hypothetical protein [Solirubrobacterales bacterium]